MKTRTKIIVAVVMTVVLLLVAAPAWAQPIDLELVGESAGLVLVLAQGKLFDLRNMNPGDTRTATIKIRNNYSRWYDLWLQAKDLTDGPDLEPGLLELLELTVTYRGRRCTRDRWPDLPAIPFLWVAFVLEKAETWWLQFISLVRKQGMITRVRLPV